MKKNKINQLLKFGILLFGVSLFIISCQKDDETYEVESKIPKSNLNLTTLKTKEIEKNTNLMRIINKAEKKVSDNKANKTVYNAEYDFTINTDYAKVIETNGLKNYTFGVYRTVDNGLLENLLLEEQADSTFRVSLVQYNITETEINSLINREIIDAEDKITFIALDDISDTVFSKVNSDAETCTVYSNVYQGGGSCYSGQHNYSDGDDCWYWEQGITIFMATNGGYVLTASEVDCGGGGSTPDPGTTNGNPDGGPQGGGYDGGTYTPPTPDTTPVLCPRCPEIEEDNGTPNTPCQELQDVSNTPSKLAKLMELKNSTGLNKEVGFTRTDSIVGFPNSTVEYQDLIWNATLKQLVCNPLGGQLYSAYGHTHYDIENQLSVFSLSDINTIFTLLESANISSVEFNVFLVTAHGTKYALKFKNLQGVQDFVNFGNTWFSDWGVSTGYNDFESQQNKIENIYEKKYKIKPRKVTKNHKNEANFARFLNDYNMGLDLYKANDDFSQWEKVNPDGTTTPCP